MNTFEVCPLWNARSGLSAQRASSQSPSFSPSTDPAAMAGQFARGKLSARKIEAHVSTDTPLVRKHLPAGEGLALSAAQRCLPNLDQGETGDAFSAIPAPHSGGEMNKRFRRTFSRQVNPADRHHQ